MVKTLLSLAAILGAATLSSASAAAERRDSLPFPDIAAITSVPQDSFTSYKKGGLVREGDSAGESVVQKRWQCSSSAQFTWGETDNGGRGVTITNAASEWAGFYIYHNSCDNVPYKYIWINAGETQFVSLPERFEGRITRGQDSYMLNGKPQTLASWFELSYDKDNVGWADVSLIRGCDGGILTWSLDNSGGWRGFTQWILDGAPIEAYDMKNNGVWVLKYTENADGSINTAPRDWYMQKVGADYVYVDDYHGNPVISSRNARFGTYWPSGRP